MNKIIGKIKYHLQRILFEKYAIPHIRHDRISKAILKKYLPADAVIVDCGAHDGADSVEFAKLFKTASVHSFEPVDKLYARLLVNTKPFKNINCYPVALADINGTMDFYISEGASDASSSLLEPVEHLKDHPNTFFMDKVIVTTCTLDSWAKDNNINKVDMLWLDMQGYELKMLAASESILDTVSVIHTEVSTKETYKGVAQYNDYRSFLEAKGFNVQIQAIPVGWDMGNVLFVKDKKSTT